MAYLRLNISNLCNFSCKYCHVFKLIDNQVPMKVMDYETMGSYIEDFIKILDVNNEKNLILSIYGGEPLINKKNLFRIVEKYGNSHNGISINWMVNTNGSMFTEEVAEFFKTHDLDVHLSADGFEETHNKNRIDKFGKKTFDKVEKALSLVQKHKVRAQINSFIFPENINNLFEIIDLAKKFGIHRIYLDLFYDTQERAMKPGTFSQKYFEAYKHGLANGVRISGPWTKALTAYTTGSLTKNSSNKNHAPSINVTADGKFFYNINPKMQPLSVENLKYEKFMANYHTSEEWFKTVVKENCSYCFLREACKGTVITNFQYHTRLDKGWKRACLSTRELIKLIKNLRRT